MLDAYAVADAILSDDQAGDTGGEAEHECSEDVVDLESAPGRSKDVRELAHLVVHLQTLASGRVFRTFAVCKEYQVAPVDVGSRRSLYGNLDALIPTASEHSP